MEHIEIPFLRETLAFLIATVIVVPLFNRMRISPVLGYLAAGAIIGPFGLGVVENVEGVRTLAELGIVFLLFNIGLELSPDRLWAMRRLVFGLGSAQVLSAALVVGLLAWLWGNGAEVALLLGACLALSSTAIIMQLLIERGELASRLGRTVFAILLFQDLAVIPILFLVNLFGAAGDQPLALSIAIALGRALIAITVVVLAGRWLLRPLFRLAARNAGSEVFIATALLVILGASVWTGASGLSMALGAFLAGLLIAETEFRPQVEIEIKPFRGLLLGLFFMSVGMGVDFAAVADTAQWVAASVGGLLAIKFVLTAGLCRLFGLDNVNSVRAGLLLGPGGEFAFIVVGSALALGLVTPALGQFMLIVAGLSMMLTPFLDIAGRRLAARVDARTVPSTEAPVDVADDLEGHVIIAGFGRVGRMVARFLDDTRVPYVAFDLDSDRVTACRAQGRPVYFGDASRPEVLAHVHPGTAAAVVVTLNNPTSAGRILRQLKADHPTLPIFVRTHDLSHAEELKSAGADHVVPETMESSLQLGGLVLSALGTPREAVDELIDRVRDTEYEALRRLDAEPGSPPDAD